MMKIYTLLFLKNRVREHVGNIVDRRKYKKLKRKYPHHIEMKNAIKYLYSNDELFLNRKRLRWVNLCSNFINNVNVKPNMLFIRNNFNNKKNKTTRISSALIPISHLEYNHDTDCMILFKNKIDKVTYMLKN